MAVQALLLFFLLSLLKSESVVYVDYRGDDSTCALNDITKPCETFSKALSFWTEDSSSSSASTVDSSSATSASTVDSSSSLVSRVSRLSEDSSSADDSLGAPVIIYGNQTGYNEIEPQLFTSVNGISSLTIEGSSSITYPFAQKSTNAKQLLTFIDIATFASSHCAYPYYYYFIILVISLVLISFT